MKNGERLYIYLSERTDIENFIKTISELEDAYKKLIHQLENTEELEEVIDYYEDYLESTKEQFNFENKNISWQDEINGLKENYNEFSEKYFSVDKENKENAINGKRLYMYLENCDDIKSKEHSGALAFLDWYDEKAECEKEFEKADNEYRKLVKDFNIYETNNFPDDFDDICKQAQDLMGELQWYDYSQDNIIHSYCITYDISEEEYKKEEGMLRLNIERFEEEKRDKEIEEESMERE